MDKKGRAKSSMRRRLLEQYAPWEGLSIVHVEVHVLQGDTIFAPLEEVVKSLPADRRETWERLHMLSDRRGGVAQPLIYPHPVTGMPSANCMHTQLVGGH